MKPAAQRLQLSSFSYLRQLQILVLLLEPLTSRAHGLATFADARRRALSEISVSSSQAPSDIAPTFAFGRVGLYYRENVSSQEAVLDLKWDLGPQHLRAQLEDMGFDVKLITSPDAELLIGPEHVNSNNGKAAPHRARPEGNGFHAYIVPPANGPSFYASVEDMSAVSSFIQDGGLVVLVEGSQGAEATKAFVSQALGYTGGYRKQKQVTCGVCIAGNTGGCVG
jgi:hypothetical protein